MYPLELLVDGGDPVQGTIPVEIDPFETQAGEQVPFEGLSQFVRDNPESPEFAHIGRYLHALLLDGDIGTRWTQEVENADTTRTCLRIDPRNLRFAPWEFLREGRRRLFAQPKHSWFLAYGPLERLEKKDELRDWPVRVLALLGDKPNGTTGVASEREALLRVQAAFKGGVHLELLDRPPRDGTEGFVPLCKKLRPHVLHFSGHAIDDGDGTSLLVSNDADGWSLNADLLENNDDLKAAPRLVILNACSTGPDDPLQDGTLPDLEDTFFKRGTLASISTQADILGSAAEAFARGFYEALGERASVDSAMAAGRRAAYEVGDPNQRDWALPRLVTRCDPTRVLPMTANWFGDCHDKVAEVDYLNELTTFVARTKERQSLVLSDRRPPRALGRKRIHFLRGNKDMGKSWLVRWLLRWCTWEGIPFSYFAWHKGQEEQQKVFEFLAKAIADTDRHHADLSLEHFEEFRERVQQAGDILTPDEIKACTDAFLAGVMATGRRLLVFDNVHALTEPEYRDVLFGGLVRAIDEDEDGSYEGIRLLVVLRKRWSDRYWPDDMAGRLKDITPIEVPDVRLNDIWHVLEEFCIVQSAPPKVVAKLKKIAAELDTWSPAWLPMYYMSAGGRP